MDDNNEDSRYLCNACFGGTVAPRRWELGKTTCMPCGQKQALEVNHCVVPLDKSAYMLVTDPQTLKQLNPKRTT